MAWNKDQEGEEDDIKEKCAVKSILKAKMINNYKYIKREVEILKKLDNPNIVKLYCVYQDNKYFHIIMELCEGGELFQYICANPFTEVKAAFYF